MRATLGILAAIALFLPAASRPYFRLGAHGAINLVVESHEARYGVSQSEGGQRLTISLGATRTSGALALSMLGGREPRVGKYPVRLWEQRVSDQPQFEAQFVAGAPDHPLGVFRAESGSVTITRAEAGRIAGEFEIEARGFVAQDPKDEGRWVTVWGRFEAQGDSVLVAVQSGASPIE